MTVAGICGSAGQLIQQQKNSPTLANNVHGVIRLARMHLFQANFRSTTTTASDTVKYIKPKKEDVGFRYANFYLMHPFLDLEPPVGLCHHIPLIATSRVSASKLANCACANEWSCLKHWICFSKKNSRCNRGFWKAGRANTFGILIPSLVPRPLLIPGWYRIQAWRYLNKSSSAVLPL